MEAATVSAGRTREPSPTWRQLFRLAATMAEMLGQTAPTSKRTASELIDKLAEHQAAGSSEAAF